MLQNRILDSELTICDICRTLTRNETVIKYTKGYPPVSHFGFQNFTDFGTAVVCHRMKCIADAKRIIELRESNKLMSISMKKTLCDYCKTFCYPTVCEDCKDACYCSETCREKDKEDHLGSCLDLFKMRKILELNSVFVCSGQAKSQEELAIVKGLFVCPLGTAQPCCAICQTNNVSNNQQIALESSYPKKILLSYCDSQKCKDTIEFIARQQ